jgi:biotin-dependent carboxylase-like uncharacterized protein
VSHGSLRVLASGPQATVQDLGRFGYAEIGVSPSGAADRGALRLANRLVGNPESAAGIEVLLGGFAAWADSTLLVAVTGALGDVTVAGRPVGMNAVTAVLAGSRLELAEASAGLRRYLAVRGGIDVPPVLGSRSTDTLGGVGPPLLAPGMLLPVGPPSGPLPGVDLAAVPPPPTDPVILPVVSGPRADWFPAGALDGATFAVSPDSDRTAVRLSGPELTRRSRSGSAPELPSEGLVAGAVQVPADGQPLIFLADHPVTGGYPVIAVVTDHGIDVAAQLRPGQQVRFSRAPSEPPGTDPPGGRTR